MTRIFHWFYMWKMDHMSGCDIRLAFSLPPRDSTLQYKRCVHLWNNFPCIITLVKRIIKSVPCFLNPYRGHFISVKFVISTFTPLVKIAFKTIRCILKKVVLFIETKYISFFKHYLFHLKGRLKDVIRSPINLILRTKHSNLLLVHFVVSS